MDDGLVPEEEIRASDADRDVVADRLAGALTEGRLDLTEYDRRLDLAMRSVTLGDLKPLTADLPPPADPEPEKHRLALRSGRWRDWVDEWRYWLGGAIIMTGIWGVLSAATQELQDFWPVIPLGIWAAILLAAAVWPDDSSRQD